MLDTILPVQCKKIDTVLLLIYLVVERLVASEHIIDRTLQYSGNLDFLGHYIEGKQRMTVTFLNAADKMILVLLLLHKFHLCLAQFGLLRNVEYLHITL